MFHCDLRTGHRCLFFRFWRQRQLQSSVSPPHTAFNLVLASVSPSPWQWLRNPGPQHEKRTLFGDMVCFLFITPLATISGWLCLRGAVDHLHFSSRLEAVGLIALTVALFTIYLFWTLVSMAHGPAVQARWTRRPHCLLSSMSALPTLWKTDLLIRAEAWLGLILCICVCV